MAGVPDYSRREAAFKLYAQYRNMSRVSKELKIPIQTLHSWKKQEKWQDKLTQLRDKLRTQHDVLKKADENFILEKDLSQLKLLEVLEQEVSKALLGEGRPKIEILEWKDLIKTLEFTAKERRLLMGEPTEREINTLEVPFLREEDLDKHIAELKRYIGEDKKPEDAGSPPDPTE
jgi:hypothetical protein